MRIAVVVFPDVQMLDVMGPIDVFHEAARQAGRPGFYQFELVAPEAGLVRAANGLGFYADATPASASADIDTLLVAGSPQLDAMEVQPAMLDWLRQQARRVRRLGSVCTGAFLLARAGLLDGRHVTTHWNVSRKLACDFPLVHVEADQIFLHDKGIYTSAGVTAGMDLALALVEEDLGREVALRVARELVMFLKRPGGQAQFSTHLAAQSAQRNPIGDVQTWALEHLGASLSVAALAKQAGMSTRHFSRLFKEEVGVTPAEFIESARVDAARRLLEETRSPLKRIAATSGFADPNGLRRAFLRQLGVSPNDYRSRFAA